MARSKRMVTHPEAPTRATVRHRTEENQPPPAVTGDLNKTPPISGEPTVVSNIADASSSKPESPKAVSSSRVSDSSPTLFDDTDLANDEEVLRLQEEFQQKVSAIKKRKEEAEQKRREEEERLAREEEERLKREEEERLQREEIERIAREEEERKRVEEEERKKVEEARIVEQERKKAEDERLALAEEDRKRLEEEKQKEVKEQTQTETPQNKNAESVEVVHSTAHSEETPTRPLQRSRGVVTRSGVTKQASSSKPKRKASRKGTGLEPSLSSSSIDTNAGSEQNPSVNPHLSTMGTDHAPSGIPRQFTSPAARAHYECICTRKLNLERGFDPDFIEANPFVKNRIVAQDWATIAKANRRANASLVREFYAEASQAKEPFVKVRGKVVDYSLSNINRVLGRRAQEPCMLGQFVAKMTPADEESILKEIAIEGRPWNKDGQRKCLYAGSLTTEAAVWFQFLRASVAPTSHDTTLSMHKCAMLYCVLTNRKINLGITMSGAIHQARTRTKVNLPLPCLITQLLIDARVPAAEDDQWLDSTTNISVQTIKKMGREIGNQPEEQVQPNVRIADEHIVGTLLPTVPKRGSPLRPKSKGEASTSTANPMTAILQALSALTYKVDLLATKQRIINRALESVWAYNRDRDEVMNRRYMAKDPLFAAELPDFPEGICPTVASEDDFEEDDGDSTPTATPTP